MKPINLELVFVVSHNIYVYRSNFPREGNSKFLMEIERKILQNFFFLSSILVCNFQLLFGKPSFALSSNSDFVARENPPQKKPKKSKAMKTRIFLSWNNIPSLFLSSRASSSFFCAAVCSVQIQILFKANLLCSNLKCGTEKAFRRKTIVYDSFIFQVHSHRWFGARNMKRRRNERC